jgi:hypothetical protein
MVGFCGNSSIDTDDNYYDTNDNRSSKVRLVSFVSANEQIGDTDNNTSKKEKEANYIGVNVRGLYTSLQHERYPFSPAPLLADYYDDSFKLISEANPQFFMEELNTVARFADRWNLHVLYDNHQYHTSSWLDPQNGTGFPEYLFRNNIDSSSSVYQRGSGGEPKDESAQEWWGKWWDRAINDTNGNDGWTLQINFLKRIIQVVDKHPSTLGYEILNEPQIHKDNEWSKVGLYNSFMVDELRKFTEKTVAYSQQIPTSLKNSAISITPENIAKIAPVNKANVVFKVTIYGEPIPHTYQGDRFSIFLEAGKLVGVPLYIGEWNNVKREKVNDDESNIVYQINSERSDLTQDQAVRFIEDFKEVDVWGWAYWNWNFIPHPAANVNLITVTENGDIDTTKYYDILKHAISNS